jgi:hypothetical protein
MLSFANLLENVSHAAGTKFGFSISILQLMETS